ncbi:hypothetical protein Pyn_13789 [Prunus yedoensis var. nudiflora]|uniref:Uncharacterized protein n=1 Tax=Prunus yedoensis var. nudiflora TaxID=2094558 RepID=A0A314Y1S5_PRUYE|nr:hypothetical protein Pyn_13789 [Prunus yedoensis var. nudiflora]
MVLKLCKDLNLCYEVNLCKLVQVLKLANVLNLPKLLKLCMDLNQVQAHHTLLPVMPLMKTFSFHCYFASPTVKDKC